MVLALHIGTLFSIFGYYREPIFFLLKRSLTQPLNPHGPAKPLYLLILACIPSALGAFILYSLVKQSFSGTLVVGTGFFLTGCFLLSTHLFFKKQRKNSFFTPESVIREYDWRDFYFFKAFLIGLIQVIAFFPGFSRSGWTISLALFLSIPRHIAIFFSFLLSLPTILGGLVVEILSKDFEWSLSLILAFFTSWFSGYLALNCLIRTIDRLLFPLFGFYLWFLTLCIFIF